MSIDQLNPYQCKLAYEVSHRSLNETAFTEHA